MKPVIQEEISGCGFACVAVLTKLTYQEVKAQANRMGIFAEDRALWSNTNYVRKLLEHYAIKADDKEIPFCSWEKLPNLVLLAIKWRIEDNIPYWHWVVFWRSPDGPIVFDPKKSLKTNARTDFGRINPKWYIKIDPNSANRAQ